MIYLDSAATTPVKPEVLDVIMNTMKNCWGNPSSAYDFGLQSRRIIEDAKKTVANSINAEPDEIIFTSGASEANALAIDGFFKSQEYEYGHFVTSRVEHSSILHSSCGIDYSVYPNLSGGIDAEDLEKILGLFESYHKTLVSIQAANNEIGAINDIKALSDITHKYNAFFHTDATQYFPYYKVDIKAMGIDMMSVSGHKFGCPKGIGFLYVKNGIDLSPIIHGTQNNGLRGGTENVSYIAGLAKSVELLDYSQSDILKQKRDYCLNKIYAINCAKKITLNGYFGDRLPNNINIRIKDVDAQTLISLLDLNGICVSAGSACHAYSSKPSHVLLAIGLSSKAARESIRITLSHETTYEEIDKFVEVLEMILTQLIN